MDTRTESEKRAFAFDMAVRLHGAHGSNTDSIMEEADKIYEYVFGKKEEPAPAKEVKPEKPEVDDPPFVATEHAHRMKIPYGISGPKSKV